MSQMLIYKALSNLFRIKGSKESQSHTVSSSHSPTPHYGFIFKKVQTRRAERKIAKTEQWRNKYDEALRTMLHFFISGFADGWIKRSFSFFKLPQRR